MLVITSTIIRLSRCACIVVQNVTLNTLEKLLSEMMELFPDEYFHIGCDETVVVNNCTLEGCAYQ